MELRGRHGTELELRITGYERPEEAVDPWESNALLVAVRVVSPQGTWSVEDPCLTTWEAARLARWLAALARADLRRGATRAEPNLVVSARPVPGAPDRLALRVRLALERRPPWVQAGTELAVDLDLTRAQVSGAAAALAAEVAEYPRRGEDPTL